MGEGLGAFLAHPALPAAERLSRGAGREQARPERNEIQKLRDLHARWTVSDTVRDCECSTRLKRFRHVSDCDV